MKKEAQSISKSGHFNSLPKPQQNNIKDTYLNDNLYIHFPEILVLLAHQKKSPHKTQAGAVQCPAWAAHNTPPPRKTQMS